MVLHGYSTDDKQVNHIRRVFKKEFKYVLYQLCFYNMTSVKLVFI